MTDLLTTTHAPGEFLRALPADDIAVSGRTIEGHVLSWERRYRVSDDGGRTFYREGWRAGALTDGIEATGNVHEVRIDHRDMRLGRVAFRQTEHGVRFTAVADGTEEGEAALAAAREGQFRGVSLRFVSKRQRRASDGTVWRIKAVPRELSLILDTRPQYEDAAIEVVRSALDTQALIERTRRNLAVDPYLL